MFTGMPGQATAQKYIAAFDGAPAPAAAPSKSKKRKSAQEMGAEAAQLVLAQAMGQGVPAASNKRGSSGGSRKRQAVASKAT